MGWPRCLQGCLPTQVPFHPFDHGEGVLWHAGKPQGGKGLIHTLHDARFGLASRALGSSLVAGLSLHTAEQRKESKPPGRPAGRQKVGSSWQANGGPLAAVLAALAAAPPQLEGSRPRSPADEHLTSSSSSDSGSSSSSDVIRDSRDSSSSSSRGTARTSGEGRAGGRRVIGTVALVGANALTYLACMASADRLYSWGAMTEAGVRGGQLWRLATYSLLHWNPSHLLVNMMSLSSLGAAVEARHGTRSMLCIYGASALSGGVASFCLSRGVSAGASGAVYGLVGALAADHVRDHGLRRSLRKLASKSLLGLVAANIVLQLTAPIDNWGHLGGFVGGLIACSLHRAIVQSTAAQPPHLRAASESFRPTTRSN